MTKEAICGAFLVAILAAIVAVVAGLYGVIYLGVMLVVALVSVQLFARKSILAKSTAIVLNTDLLYKVLMPRKYKKAIKELDETRQKK